MERYRVWIDQQEYLVEIDQDHITVNGEVVVPGTLNALNDQGLFFFRQDDNQQEIHIQRQSATQFSVTIGGHHLTAEVERERSSGRGTKARSSRQQAGEIRAPMHSVMIDLLVQEGDLVQEGQTLLVLEAMKMQMKVNSPFNGTVREILRRPGERVEKGEILLKLQPQQAD